MLADLLHKIAEMEFTEKNNLGFYPRPSSAGPDRCIRQMVYHGLKIPKKPLPGRTLHVFDDGHWHEELILDWLRKSSYKIHSEQMEIRCREPMNKGHIDAIFTDMLGIDRLLEIKGINHFTFQRYWGGELPLDNLTQCAVYMDGIQAYDNPDLKEGLLLIKNKNTAQYMEFEIEYDRNSDILTISKSTNSTGEIKKIDKTVNNIVQSACDKFSLVLDYINKKTLPKRQYHIDDDWQCDYCGWATPCWKGYEQEFSELNTEADLPNEIADTVRYYKELGAQKSEMEKEYKAIAQKIKSIMKDAGAREGRAGEYIVRLKLYESNKIDKALLTPAELEKATVKGFSERMYISKIGGKNDVQTKHHEN